MKNISNNILVVALALLVGWVSGGVNISSYCCNACKENGQKMFSTLTCEEVHTMHQCADVECNHLLNAPQPHICSGDGCCSHADFNDNYCDIYRTQVIILTQNSIADWDFSAPQIQLFVAQFQQLNMSQVESAPLVIYNNLTPPPLFEGGRDILSQNSLLLI